MFAEVEGIIKRQINVSMAYFYFTFSLIYPISMQCNFVPGYSLFQMSVLPSVQPFHAIAYPIDPLLALEIRCSISPFAYALQNECSSLKFFLCYCSRSYASHCLKIASRFSLPSFNHPSPVAIKRNGGFERLRIGYVFT